jgi:hypothetical protein
MALDERRSVSAESCGKGGSPSGGGRGPRPRKPRRRLGDAGREAIALDPPADDPDARLTSYVEPAVTTARDQQDTVVVAQLIGAVTAPGFVALQHSDRDGARVSRLDQGHSAAGSEEPGSSGPSSGPRTQLRLLRRRLHGSSAFLARGLFVVPKLSEPSARDNNCRGQDQWEQRNDHWHRRGGAARA